VIYKIIIIINTKIFDDNMKVYNTTIYDICAVSVMQLPEAEG